MTKHKMKNKKRLINAVLYLDTVGLSIVVFAFGVASTWIGTKVKAECQQAHDNTARTVCRHFAQHWMMSRTASANGIRPSGPWA